MQLPGGRARVQIQSVGVPSSGSQQAAKLLIPKVAARLEGGDCFSPPASPLADPLLDLLPARCACKIAQKSHPLFIPDSSTSFRSCSVDA